MTARCARSPGPSSPSPAPDLRLSGPDRCPRGSAPWIAPQHARVGAPGCYSVQPGEPDGTSDLILPSRGLGANLPSLWSQAGKAGGLKSVNRSKRLVDLAPPEVASTLQTWSSDRGAFSLPVASGCTRGCRLRRDPRSRRSSRAPRNAARRSSVGARGRPARCGGFAGLHPLQRTRNPDDLCLR
jgi:hypothetical protein